MATFGHVTSSRENDTPNLLGEQWMVVGNTQCSACNLGFVLVRSASRVEGGFDPRHAIRWEILKCRVISRPWEL